MKFELKPYNLGASDEELISDLKKVAEILKSNSLSKKEYLKHGRFNYSTITRRFGSWNKALESAGLEIENFSKLSVDELLKDLKEVAVKLNKNSLTRDEYVEIGKYSTDSFRRHFGSWFKALEKAGLEKTHNLNISNEELFENLEEVWTRLGRQPSFGEISKPLSKYSGSAYSRRFGSWRKALEAFVKYVNDDSEAIKEEVAPILQDEDVSIFKHKTGRNINWRLRFIVMKRDNFRCKNCGRSPATDQSIILHVDHIKAWANGGETVLENLQTLCSVCNIGKSSLE
jgi:predicted restriction endonuclease